jgi:hypothetical protein
MVTKANPKKEQKPKVKITKLSNLMTLVTGQKVERPEAGWWLWVDPVYRVHTEKKLANFGLALGELKEVGKPPNFSPITGYYELIEKLEDK